MYLSHFGFHEPPFRITPDTDFFFGGANRGATLEALLYAVSHDEGIVKVSGEVGSGKTMLCRVLMERLPADVATVYLANPSLSRDDILIAVADELKLDLGSERSTRVLRSLQDELVRLYAQGKRVVALIDEAHAMPRETLEEIRLLSNLEANRRKLLQIVLFGQPELDEVLDTSDMRQLKERITHSFRLSPMSRSDIESYVEFRLRAAGYRGPNPFNSAALRRIASASDGLTRRVNIIADKALLAAFAANTHAVGEREVKRAIRDSEFYRSRQSRAGRVAAVAGVAGIAAGFAIAWAMLEPGHLDRDAQAPSRSASVANVPNPAAADTTVQPNPVRKALESRPPVAPSVKVAARDAGEMQRGVIPGPDARSSQDPAPVPPQAGKLVQQRFASTQEWLKSAPGRHVALQLMTVGESDVPRLEQFLARAARLVDEEQLHVYSVKIEGAQHYRAAYGDFSGRSEAEQAITGLPPLLAAQSPFQRSVARMRSQNAQ